MKTNLILLAAGNSTRFKGNKIMHEFQGKPLGVHIIDKGTSVPFNSIILVTQYKEFAKLVNDKYNSISSEKIEAKFESASECVGDKLFRINIIINDEPNKGISHSIKLGLEQCKDCDSVMFAVCDQPFITEKTMNGMIKAMKDTEKNIICAGDGDALGNPTLFHMKYREELMKLEGDVGGKKVIKKLMGDTFIYQVEDVKELIDFDTKESLGV